QRYSLIDQKESKLAFVDVAVAYKPIEQLSFAAGFLLFSGFYNARIAFNANPRDRLLGAPEDRSYDSVAQLNAGFIAAPGFNLGVQATPHEAVRLGASLQSGFAIKTPADLSVRLPDAAPFDRASVRGNNATLRFSLPWVARFGVEVRPIPPLRIEAAMTYDFWSGTRSLDVAPDNVQLLNITGFPSPYRISPISIPLALKDGPTYRLGAEYKIEKLPRKIRRMHIADAIAFRTGVMIDPSATPYDYSSVLTFDLDKVHLGFGVSTYAWKNWRFDIMYMHTFIATRDVNPRTAAISGVNPVRGNPTATEAVNGGTYSGYANTLGVGLEYKFR
ncbi:MAG: rane protein involved in aromatic hydrocarbon degradation, partial [Myxococcaceae bacterium]|nr:rane protein involved in aromatic hydrocarbon degradation [Myxococcaceae bacterium]